MSLVVLDAIVRLAELAGPDVRQVERVQLLLVKEDLVDGVADELVGDVLGLAVGPRPIKEGRIVHAASLLGFRDRFAARCDPYNGALTL